MTVNRSDFQGKPQRSSVDDDALGLFWDPTDPQGEPFVAPKSAFGGSGSGGADGKTVRNGSGAPSAGLGVDGDFYINTAANTIYGPKTAGAWGSPTSLVGPTGATGSAGATGATGPAGSIATDTIYDAKGDIAVGTGADAASKLAVGADSLVPIANSSASTGLRYGSLNPAPYFAGTLLSPNGGRANSASVAPPAAGRMGAVFVWIPRRLTIDRVEINCTTAQAGETLRIGVYDNVGGVPTNLIADWGTVDASTVAAKAITGLTTVLDPGVYWIAYVAQGGTSNARYWGASNPAGAWQTVTWSSATTDWSGGVQANATTTTGALPSTFGALSGVTNGSYLFVCPRMA